MSGPLDRLSDKWKVLGAKGVAMGVQLVGRRNFDARLLRTARWLEAELGT